MARKRTPGEIDAEATRLCLSRSYGDLERLAGVTDREAWWKGKTEDEGRAELRALIRARVERREIGPALDRQPVPFSESDCGGAFDGTSVISDADPGL